LYNVNDVFPDNLANSAVNSFPTWVGIFDRWLQVLKASIEHQDGHTGEENIGEEMLQWPKAIGSNPTGDTKISLEALGRLTETWGYSRKRANNKIMPFIAEVDFQTRARP
jgi:hypothetical protein